MSSSRDTAKIFAAFTGSAMDDKGDESFCNLLLEYLQEMSPPERLRIRMELTDLVMKFAYPEEYAARQNAVVKKKDEANEKEKKRIMENHSEIADNQHFDVTAGQSSSTMRRVTHVDPAVGVLAAAFQDIERLLANAMHGQLIPHEQHLDVAAGQSSSMIRQVTHVDPATGVLAAAVQERERFDVAVGQSSSSSSSEIRPVPLGQLSGVKCQAGFEGREGTIADIKQEVPPVPRLSRVEMRRLLKSRQFVDPEPIEIEDSDDDSQV